MDEKNRLLYFLAGGKDPKTPYFLHFYKISFDGKNLTALTPEEGDHSIALSPSKNYFIDDYSQPDVSDVIVLRNINGKLITTLEKKCFKAESNRLVTSKNIYCKST